MQPMIPAIESLYKRLLSKRKGNKANQEVVLNFFQWTVSENGNNDHCVTTKCHYYYDLKSWVFKLLQFSTLIILTFNSTSKYQVSIWIMHIFLTPLYPSFHSMWIIHLCGWWFNFWWLKRNASLYAIERFFRMFENLQIRWMTATKLAWGYLRSRSLSFRLITVNCML
jgi:hypothetical protein